MAEQFKYTAQVRVELMNPSYEDVLRANRERGDEIKVTPLIYSPSFSHLTCSETYLKAESQQKTGSFKIRGAYYKVKMLPAEEKRRGVVAASAGNHAQGVAYAAYAEKIPCTIVMPKSASPAKVAATRGYGANVILDGSNYDEAWVRARQISRKTGAAVIHAFDDPQVIAAQGVIGLEILEELPDVEEVYVPVGGGGLVAGILIAIKTKHPSVRVVGVQSMSFPAMRESVQKDRLVEAGGHRTIADGISVRKPGEITFSIIRDLIDDIVLVDDSEIINAMFLLLERSKMLVEPAGAVGLAYLLSKKPALGKKVVTILAGGNVDMYLLGQIVDKGLAAAGRLMKISILLPDVPGALKSLVDEIALANANIVEVSHDRLSSSISAGSAGVVLSLETQGRKSADFLIRRLQEKKINFKLLT